MAEAITDLDKLCIHTITTKPWNIETAISKYSKAGVKGITVWRQWLENRDIKTVHRQIVEAGLQTVSICRGGFFPNIDKKARQQAIEDNIRSLEEAAALDAPHVVLVCGADPKQSLKTSRQQILDGILAVLDTARDLGVKLAIEPLHPMYADTRSAVNTMEQANDLCDKIDDPFVGVAVDVYHVWWDPDLEKQVRRCGAKKRIFAFHICDWLSPTKDLLNDRGLMGDGCIPIPHIRELVESSGFKGFNEVEIFSNHWWQQDQDAFLNKIIETYKRFG